jgi:undecaprenyl diphosphate synthase
VVVTAHSTPPLPHVHTLPQHVAVIMDGNGRWAQARGLSRQEGHRAGAENLRAVIERFGAHGVQVLTLFAFSTENWGRPRAEVQTILRLGGEFIDRYLGELHQRGVQLRHLGDPERLPGVLQKKVRQAVERTAHNDRMIVNLAFNYGGRADIVAAVQRLIAEGVPAERVTEEAISARLATAGQPEPDLLIRTGGERRVSNFLVWQSSYSEYYFTDLQWPDFDAAAVDAALLEYAQRRRRFGRVSNEGPGDPAGDPGADD